MDKFKYNSKNINIGFSESMLYDILKIRGVTDVDKFLNVTEDVVEDFKLYDNILEARNRILHHITNGNKVLILVD